MILSNPFKQEEFTDFVKEFLPNFKLDVRKIDPGKSGFREVIRLGASSEIRTEVLVVKSAKNINSRISLTNNSFKILKQFSIYRALVVYVNDDESIWRLSLLTAKPTLTEDGKIVITLSNPKRHSYILGTDVGIATAKKYLSTKGRVQNFEDLEYRFSVDVVNQDFYLEITEHFYNLVGKYGSNKEVIQKPILKLPSKDATLEDLQNYSVRLLGRLIFIWFLREKMGNTGKSLLPLELLEVNSPKGDDFFNTKIEPLFFEVLNKPVSSRNIKYQQGHYGDVAYLNGGLFQPSEGLAGDYYSSLSQTSNISIPNEWFNNLFSTFKTFNFTIDENLENDVDLSIDPEMLGRVFENLLAEINPETGQIARKSTGSYYTPRSIVNYMVDESLTKYLVTKTGIHLDKIKALVSTSKLDDLEFPLNEKERLKVIDAISSLKVLDPACGSGAFPMGVLQKLLWIISQVDAEGSDFLENKDMELTEHWLSTGRLDYLRKRKIIRDTLFGIDIQPVAVEIAKLRCFLTLVVDQEIDDLSANRGVVPLPNLDFKFICANTLIPLAEQEALTLGEDPNLETELQNIRSKYFNTTNLEKKINLRKVYESKITQQVSLFGESNRTRQLKTYHPFQTDSSADFFDSQYMFGFEKFDVVIANPPYIDSEGMINGGQTEAREFISKNYKYAKGNWDIYIAFFEKGLDLLSTEGVLIYITPDKWIGKPFGDALRIGTLDQIASILVAGRNVFKSATIDSIITTFNNKDTEIIEVLTIEDGNFVVKNAVSKKLLKKPYYLDFLMSEHLDFLVEVEEKFDQLSSIAECENACATSDAYKLKPLVSELSGEFNPRTQMKVVNTGTNSKFANRWGHDQMTYLGSKYSKPVVDKKQFQSEFPNSYSKKAVLPKVILKGLNLLDGSLDLDGHIVPGKTTLIITSQNLNDLLFVSGVINSNFAFFYIKERYQAASYNQGTSFTPHMINSLPIPINLTDKRKQSIVDIVERINGIRQINPSRDISKSLEELNSAINDLYGFSKKQIELIDSVRKY